MSQDKLHEARVLLNKHHWLTHFIGYPQRICLLEMLLGEEGNRHVLLNSRALHALKKAKEYIAFRMKDNRPQKDFPYCFPPSQGDDFIQSPTTLQRHWEPAITAAKVRYRKPYAARHTYATMCLMAGMNTAFIAKQLGHSIDMLLNTYAQWLSSDTDWNEMDKLRIAPKLPQERTTIE